MKNYAEKIRNNLLYAGLKPHEYWQIEGEIIKSNYQNLKIFTVVASVFLLFMFLFSFFVSDIQDNRWIYFILLVFIIAVSVVSKQCYYKGKYMWACIYTFTEILYGFGIILGTVAEPSARTVTFIAVLLTAPLLFTDKPIRAIFNLVVNVILFIIAAVAIKEKSVLIIDIINVCVFGAISAIDSTYMMKLKCQRYLYEKEVTALSETGLLTGLRNRNSFDLSIDTFYSLCRESLCCVYADANGLHELNNLNNHEAGDKMLQFVADTLKQKFGEKYVYRIGGDEFVAIAADIDTDNIRMRIGEVRKTVERKGYSLSMGYEIQSCNELNIDTLIKSAERKMYEDKRRYYERTGKANRNELR